MPTVYPQRYTVEKYNPSTGVRDCFGTFTYLETARLCHREIGGRILDNVTKKIWTDNMGMWMPTMVEVTR